MSEEKQKPPDMSFLARRNRIEHSTTIAKQRENIALEIIGLAATSITDVVSWGDDGHVKVKSSKSLKPHAARSIKKIRTYTDKDGNQQVELEMHDKISMLRLLAKAAGLLDQQDGQDKPSVIGINIKAPTIIDQEDV